MLGWPSSSVNQAARNTRKQSFSQGENQTKFDAVPEETIDLAIPDIAHVDLSHSASEWIGTSYLAFSGDSKWLANIVGRGNCIEIWNVQTQKLAHRLEAREAVFAIQFSATGETLFAGYRNGKVRSWDVKSGKVAETWEDPENPPRNILGLGVSPDGKWVVSCGYLPTLWNLQTKKPTLLELDLQHERGEDVRHIVFSPSGRQFVTCFRRLLIWETASGKVLKEVEGNEAGWRLTFAPDGKSFATCGGPGPFTTIRNGGVVQFWDANKGTEIRAIRGLCEEVYSIAFTADNKFFLAGGRADQEGKEGCVYWWNLATGKMTKLIIYHAYAVTRLAVSPDGNWLVTGGGVQGDSGARLHELSRLLHKN